MLLPAAPPRAGMPSQARRLMMARAVMIALFSGLAHDALAADTPADTLKKVKALYDGAKTFQGTMTMRSTATGKDGKKITSMQVQEIQYRAPNQFRVHTTSKSTVPGAKPMEALTVADGSMVYMYRPAAKIYMKRELPKNRRSILSNLVPNPSTPGIKALPPTTVQGRPALVFSVPPPEIKLPKDSKFKLPPRKPVTVLVDKQNYRLLRLVSSMGTASMEYDLTAQNFSPNFPASTFTFTPPPGAKEQPMRPMMPSARPGAPGGAVPGGTTPPAPRPGAAPPGGKP